MPYTATLTPSKSVGGWATTVLGSTETRDPKNKVRTMRHTYAECCFRLQESHQDKTDHHDGKVTLLLV